MSYGFYFNDTHSSTHGIIMKSKNRQVLPAVDDSYIQIPGRHGSYLHPGNLSDKVITVECAVAAVSLEDLRKKAREIAVWLYTTERKQLTFDDEPDIYYLAKLEGAIDLEQIATHGKFGVSFRCEPLAYGVDIEQNFSNGVVTVNNPGTFEAMPLFQVTFTAAADEVRIDLDGKFIRVIRHFARGDILEINTATGAVLLNNIRILENLDWQYSTFFTIQPGEWDIYLTKPTTGVNAKIIYRPRYL